MDSTSTSHLYRPINQSIRSNVTWNMAWEGPDKGLIRCWEIGRQKAESHPDLAQKCREDQLPVLGWKGGHDRAIQKPLKFGSLKYLAQWQGLRGEDLSIETAREITLTCSRTGMRTTFTPEQSKYADATLLGE